MSLVSPAKRESPRWCGSTSMRGRDDASPMSTQVLWLRVTRTAVAVVVVNGHGVYSALGSTPDRRQSLTPANTAQLLEPLPKCLSRMGSISRWASKFGTYLHAACGSQAIGRFLQGQEEGRRISKEI